MRPDSLSGHSLCQGWLSHQRLAGAQSPAHSFGYPIWMAWLDIDALPTLNQHGPCWGFEKPALVTIRCRDYLTGLQGTRLRDRLNLALTQAGLPAPSGQIFLLSQPRSWGHGFNPVSFWFCYSNDPNPRLQYLLAEVTNTPWGERHVYVAAVSPKPDAEGVYHFQLDKVLHVSPFMPMQQRYEWHLRLDAEKLRLHMQSQDANGVCFNARLLLRHEPLTTGNATRVALLQPWQNGRNLLRIYWQALRLWWRGARFHAHPAPRTKSHAIPETAES